MNQNALQQDSRRERDVCTRDQFGRANRPLSLLPDRLDLVFPGFSDPTMCSCAGHAEDCQWTMLLVWL
jgi:hypothetical protein